MVKFEHSDNVKRIRRKIEEKLRQDFSEEKVIGLANLLDIDTRPQDKNQKKETE
jgi:hypothetical protein